MSELTRMERIVWTELSWGRTLGETAESLGIKESTVRTHLKHLYQKLQVNNRVLLALKFHNLERDESRENKPNGAGREHSPEPGSEFETRIHA